MKPTSRNLTGSQPNCLAALKKVLSALLIPLAVLGSSTADAQQPFTFNSNNDIISNPGSNVGIGMAPVRKLTVNGDIQLYKPSPGTAREITAATQTGTLHLETGTQPFDGSLIQLHAANHPTGPGKINFYTPGTTGTSFTFFATDPTQGTFKTLLSMEKSGQANFNGDISLQKMDDAADREVTGRTSSGAFNLLANTNASDGSGIQMFGRNHANAGKVNFYSAGSASGVGFEFMRSDWNNTFVSCMKIIRDGRVIIGRNIPSNKIFGSNIDPDKYRLYVENGILTERIKVALVNSGDWMDRVFDPQYELRSLEEVDAYVQNNCHLPDVPSAAELVETGIDVTTMNATLLRKIEELTLYTIDLKKQTVDLQRQLDDLKDKK